MITTLENTPVEIDLLLQGRSTGWSVNGTKATHETCNSGRIYLVTQPLTAGSTYVFSYQLTVSSGYVRPYVGTTAGTSRTTSGFYVETVVAAGTNPLLNFDSNANAEIEILDIKEQVVVTSNTKPDSVVFSPQNAKWTTRLTYTPDASVSMFTNVFNWKNGLPYVSKPDSGDRNNFFGIQFESEIEILANQQPMVSKTFQSISLQNSILMVTTEDGIQTSLGGISELIDEDFLKDIIDDGITEIRHYSKEGVYSAAFMRDKNNGGLIEGAELKGNWIAINLKTAEEGILRLFSVNVHSAQSKIGSR